jgi:hypothetical protein
MTVRNPLLWGDADAFQVTAGVAVNHTTRQLIHVQAPMPCTWNVWVTLIGPRDVPFAVTPFLTLGVGRIVTPLTIPNSVPAVPQNPLFEIQDSIINPPIIQRVGRIRNVSAQSILGLLFISQAAIHVLATDTWTATLWIAPETPWTGLETSVVPRHEDKGLDLDEASKSFENARRIWRNR